MAQSTVTQPDSGQSFFVAGGSLQRDARSYVVRRADGELLDSLRTGQFCYVLTSRQMGKSSLMVRTAERLRAQGVVVAVLDLTAIGQNVTVEQWYNGLLNSIGKQVRLEDELEDFWFAHENLPPLQRWVEAIREIMLERLPGQVVLLVDEVDAILSLPFSADEFLAGLRECDNRRSEDAEMRRLTFGLFGVASPAELIREARTTPFNIGHRIELSDFTPQEAEPLANGLNRPLSQPSPQERGEGDSSQAFSSPVLGGGIRGGGKALLKRVLHWTGGHPYLTQHLCKTIADDEKIRRPADVDRLCQDLFFSSRARERDTNLLFVRERLLRTKEDRVALLDLYGKIRRGGRFFDDEASPLVTELRLSGIVRVENGVLSVRNRIYARVFDKAWVTSNQPGAELRRQRFAYRKGFITAAIGIGSTSLSALALVYMLFFYGRASNFRVINAQFVDENGVYYIVKPFGNKKDISLAWDAPWFSFLKLVGKNGGTITTQKMPHGSGTLDTSVIVDTEKKEAVVTYQIGRWLGGGTQNLTVHCIYTSPQDKFMQASDRRENMPLISSFEGKAIYELLLPKGRHIALYFLSKDNSSVTYWPVHQPGEASSFKLSRKISPGKLKEWGRTDLSADGFTVSSKEYAKEGDTDTITFMTSDPQRYLETIRLVVEPTRIYTGDLTVEEPGKQFYIEGQGLAGAELLLNNKVLSTVTHTDTEISATAPTCEAQNDFYPCQVSVSLRVNEKIIPVGTLTINPPEKPTKVTPHGTRIRNL